MKKTCRIYFQCFFRTVANRGRTLDVLHRLTLFVNSDLERAKSSRNDREDLFRQRMVEDNGMNVGTSSNVLLGRALLRTWQTF